MEDRSIQVGVGTGRDQQKTDQKSNQSNVAELRGRILPNIEKESRRRLQLGWPEPNLSAR